MRIFKTSWFTRFTARENITDDALKEAIGQLGAGLFDADLGGGVYKQRLARRGSGKSGGYRVLICFRQDERSFFVYGFTKSDKATVAPNEKSDLKKLAKALFTATDAELERMLKSGQLSEISEVQ